MSLSFQHILIAPDKFKHCLTSMEVADAVARGVWKSQCGATWERSAIADGGEGFSEIIGNALGMTKVTARARDALGRRIYADYRCGYVDREVLAVMEMSATAGLWQIQSDERDPLHSSTYGVGEMIRSAVNARGAKRVLLGIGGSATNDGGVGLAAALGCRFLDANGVELTADPASLHGKLAAIDRSEMIALPPIEVACDVENPLLGKTGATAVFGSQKGLSPADAVIAEEVLARIVELLDAADLALRPGAGAAGGLGFGLMAFCGGVLKPGFGLVAETLGLDEKIRRCDLVITGEGSVDAQSLHGKAPVGLARMARAAGKPVWMICGRADKEFFEEGSPFDRVFVLLDREPDIPKAMASAAELVVEEVCEALQ